jgi:tripeptidyl-peptidase I
MGINYSIDDARLRAGKPTMGFINPWLYERGYKGMQDITNGSAKGCQGIDLQSGRSVKNAAVIKGASINATKGWDAVTGFGVPDFEAMKDWAMQ